MMIHVLTLSVDDLSKRINFWIHLFERLRIRHPVFRQINTPTCSDRHGFQPGQQYTCASSVGHINGKREAFHRKGKMPGAPRSHPLQHRKWRGEAGCRIWQHALELMKALAAIQNVPVGQSIQWKEEFFQRPHAHAS